jgi:Na+/proline symporter
MVAKVIGAALKIYVVCSVMQILVFDHFDISFTINVLFTLLVVWLYTRTGGVRSLIATDILQSLCLVASIIVCIWAICHRMDLSLGAAVDSVISSPYSQMWFFDDHSSSRYFWKMVAGGALCLVAMTGLDQDMMQRNMSCRTIRDSQTNIILTAICQAIVILLFLSLGALIYRYIDFAALPAPARGDDAFPLVATQGGLPVVAGVMFVIGLISSTYSAAGASLTALTTAFTLDIMDGRKRYDEAALTRLRHRTHIVMAAILFVVILVFKHLASDSIINLVFKVAGYTYGPILGMFVFGMISRRNIRQKAVPAIALLSPIMSYILQWVTAEKFGYHIGFELLGYNALFTIFGFYFASTQNKNKDE